MNETQTADLSYADMMDPVEKEIVEKLSTVADAITHQVQLLAGLQQSIAQLAQTIQQINKPKRVVRGPDNRVIGIE
jgi:hypothetical protein